MQVTVAVTPNGRADAVTHAAAMQPTAAPQSEAVQLAMCDQPASEHLSQSTKTNGPQCAPLPYFALPLEETVSLADLLHHLQRQHQAGDQNTAPAHQHQRPLAYDPPQHVRADGTLQQRCSGCPSSTSNIPSSQPVNPATIKATANDRDANSSAQSTHANSLSQLSLKCNCRSTDTPAPNATEVWYLQQQNNNLREHFAELAADIDMELPWATQAFGQPPEAVNLWIGNELSVTSFHRDHYENLYVVIAGSKTFTLLPPTDAWQMHVQEFPVAQYQRRKERLELVPTEPVQTVRWSAVEYVLDPDTRQEGLRPVPGCEPVLQHTCTAKPVRLDRVAQHDDNSTACKDVNAEDDSKSTAKPFRVTVHPGEVLYLPSMWYHQVEQTPDAEGRNISVNYWYDMSFDIKYAYAKFVEQLVQQQQ